MLITVESSEETTLKGYDFGASDIINKPFNPKIVTQRVENLIQLFLHRHHLESLVSQQKSILKEQSDRLKRSSNFLIDTLSTVVEFRTGESGQHIKRMRGITCLLYTSIHHLAVRISVPHKKFRNARIKIIKMIHIDEHHKRRFAKKRC